MRETRLSGSEGGGFEFNRFSLPLSSNCTITHNTSPLTCRLPNGMVSLQNRKTRTRRRRHMARKTRRSEISTEGKAVDVIS